MSTTSSSKSHWGAFEVTVDDEGRITGVAGHPDDAEPSALLGNFADAAHLTRTFYQMFGMAPSALMKGKFAELPSPFDMSSQGAAT